MSLVQTLIVAAKMFSVPPALLLSICSAESDFRPRTNLHDGGSASYGACQIKLGTAHMFDKKIGPALLSENPVNARIAAEYIRYQMDRYPDDLECVIVAYNAGSCYRDLHGRLVDKRGKPSKNNHKYLNRVKPRLEQYERQFNAE